MARSDRPPVIDGIENLVIVGAGGFAVVYHGHQPAFRRDVAVKVLQRSGLDEQDRNRFDRECQAMGALSDHPGIVTLYDAGFTADGQPYLVMAYVASGTLADRIAEGGPLSWQDVTDLGVRLAGALETAHRAGVLHRDIKPANILRARYGDQLSDFGIARIQGGHETRSGVITASIAHAAPEILDGRPPTPQADIYALASTLYEALTGRAAFVGESDEGLLPMIRRVVSEQPPDLREQGVPGVIAALIETAMAKDPAQRYPSAEAFGLALRGAQSVLDIHVSDLVIVGDVGAAAADGGPPTAPAPPVGTGAGQTIVVEPPPDAEPPPPPAPPSQADVPPIPPDVPPPDGPHGPPPDDAAADVPPPADPPPDDAAADVPPPAAAFAAAEPASGRRKKGLLIGGGLLGAAALVVGVLIVTADRADAPSSPVATDLPRSDVSVAGDTIPGTAVDSTTPPDTNPPDTTPDTTAGSEPIDPVLAGIGVLAFSVGAEHPVLASLEQAAVELGVPLTVSDPAGQPADELFKLVAAGQNPIIALAQDPTGEAVSAITESAAAHPDVTFVVIDAVVDSPNVSSTSFADHEGSFMVGAIAALTSTTGRIGFIGGIDNLRIRRYEAGFVAGARHVLPETQIDVRYFPGDGERVDDAGLERETATAMYDLGADVIYHAGTVGIGLYQAAAAEPGRWAIGADTDRALSVPPELRDSILTSMVKGYAAVAADALQRSVDEVVAAGLVTRGLADGGVDWSTTGGHLDAIADDIAAVADDVLTGRVEVPSLVVLRALAPLGPDCPSDGCIARIIGADLDGSELAVRLEANWFMDVEANHVHYFWSPRYEPNQVGTDSAERFDVEVGAWDIDDSYPVYVTEEEVSLGTRRVEDTRLCLTPADAAHNVIDPALFDCLIFQS